MPTFESITIAPLSTAVCYATIRQERTSSLYDMTACLQCFWTYCVTMHFSINRRVHRFSAKYKYTKWDLTQPIRICISDQRESTDPKCVHCLWLLWRWMLKVVLRSKQWADSLVILICECRKVEQTCIRATEDSEWAGRGWNTLLSRE